MVLSKSSTVNAKCLKPQTSGYDRFFGGEGKENSSMMTFPASRYKIDDCLSKRST